MAVGTLYHGNGFDVDRHGSDWTIWRIADDDGNREQIILTQDAMDELRDYFADCYPEDRAAVT